MGAKGMTVPSSAHRLDEQTTFRANDINVSEVNIMSDSKDASKSKMPESCLNIVAKKRPPPMNIGFSFDGIEPTRRVLYRNFHDIDGQVYLVEISRNKKKVFVLLFPNFERPD
jgi:hypothetical protein